jgi:inorganic pyrophosphatase
MANLAGLANELDARQICCRAIIETPRGRRTKFDYDPETELFELAGLLPEGMVFPYDFGFIPSTLGADGDPLDVMVLMDEPAHVGCLIDVRLIGVIEADQTEKNGKTKQNPRLLAVAVHSYTHEHIASIKELNKSMLGQIEAFFVQYNQLRGKKFKVTGRGGPKRALELLREAIRIFDEKQKK